MSTKTAVIILVALALLVGGGYLYYQSLPRSISFVSPKSGDTWVTGETHTISWKTSRVPSSYKIGVHIRRVPELSGEGQQYDPVVFTNLPNSGSTSWTISDMYPTGTYVLDLIAYESLPITDQNSISVSSAPITIARDKLSQDLYPLYKGATSWSTTTVATYEIGTTTYLGAGAQYVAATNTMNIAAVTTPFEQYYRQKLNALGWKKDISLEAGGPGASQEGYRKGYNLIIVMYKSVFHDTAPDRPVQCPCDVTLTLFSTP